MRFLAKILFICELIARLVRLADQLLKPPSLGAFAHALVSKTSSHDGTRRRHRGGASGIWALRCKSRWLEMSKSVRGVVCPLTRAGCRLGFGFVFWFFLR